MAIDWGTELGGNSPQQSQGSVGNAVVASGSAQSAAIDRLQRHKNIVKRYIDDMGQASTETPGGIFGRLWPYGGKVYTDQQLADAKSAVDRAQTDDEVYQAIRNLDYASHQDDVGTGMVDRFLRGINNTPIPSIGNNSFLGNERTTYELPGDDSSWAYAIGKYGGGLIEPASDLAGAGSALKMAKAARFNPFTFAGMLYRDAKQTGKDIVNLPGNIVKGIRNAGSKTSNFVKDSVKAGTEGKSLKAYNAERTAAPAGETVQTGGRAAETAAPAAERTAAPAPRQEPAPAPRQEPAPQQPAPAPRQEPAPQQPAPAPERTAASETAADGGVSELANAGNAGREAAAAGGQAAGREAAAGEAAADGGVSELANAGAAGREAAAAGGQAAGREAAAAGGQAAGREAATGEAAADGGVSELANAGSAGREAAAGGQASGTILASRRSYIDGLADYINGQSKAFGTADRANISKWLTDGYPDLNDAELSYILDKVFAARTVP